MKLGVIGLGKMGEAITYRLIQGGHEVVGFDTHEKTGYVQQTLEGLRLNPESDVVYLCGNPNMIDEVFTKLKELEFETKQVRREKYIS